MLRLLIAAPFLVVLVLFALSNTQSEQLHLWPTDFAVVLPLSIAILAAMGIGFFIGAVFLWFTLVSARARARRAERALEAADARGRELGLRVQELEARNAALSMARAGTPLALPGTAPAQLALAR